MICFPLVLLHRLKRIDVLNSGTDDEMTFKWSYSDSLEYTKNGCKTKNTGDILCANDYISFVRNQLESQIATSYYMLNRTCSNFRGTATGKNYKKC